MASRGKAIRGSVALRVICNLVRTTSCDGIHGDLSGEVATESWLSNQNAYTGSVTG